MDGNGIQDRSVTHKAEFNDRIFLGKLRLAADAILELGGDPDLLPDPLETELSLFKGRIDHSLTLAGLGQPGDNGGSEVGPSRKRGYQIDGGGLQASSITDKIEFLDRASLERLRLAADVILELGEDADVLPGPLEAELFLFRDRVHRALLMAKPGGSGDSKAS